MAQHTEKVGWVPEMYEEAAMEREVGDECRSPMAGRDPGWSRRFQGR